MFWVEEIDGLFCVFEQERLGQRIVSAFATKKEAVEAVKRYKEGK